jgi:hypothetical protein
MTMAKKADVIGRNIVDDDAWIDTLRDSRNLDYRELGMSMKERVIRDRREDRDYGSHKPLNFDD